MIVGVLCSMILGHNNSWQQFAVQLERGIKDHLNYTNLQRLQEPGMCGAAFYSARRGGAKVKIRGAGWGGVKVKIRGAGRGEKARKSTNSKILQKCEKYNITYYNTNYNIIIILYQQKTCIVFEIVIMTILF